MRAMTLSPPETPRFAVVDQNPFPVIHEAFEGLMQLHRELMVEKDDKLALTRDLMERRQEVAELQSYVRLLERELERARAAEKRADVEGWR
ncbi:MAG: hypothetical protein ACYCWW_19660 [Deltaproteobacteria bacterium]